MNKRKWSRRGVAALTAAGVLAMAATLYAAGGAEAHGGVPSAKLWDFLWRVMNFAALVFILVHYLRKPLVNGLHSRRETVKAELEELEAKKAEAERVYKECEAKLSGLEAEAKSILDEAVKQGELEKQRIVTEAERAAGDMKRQAEMAVQHELAIAKANLRAEIAEQAALAAGELIKSNLQPADQTKMVEEYLEKVGGIQ